MNQFKLQGINHLALVCRDMARTVDFYTNILGLKLIKTIALAGGGQHFFFDGGNGDALAFFWFPNAPAPAPGIASVDPERLKKGDIVTAHGSMNHVAFNISLEHLQDDHQKFSELAIPTPPILHHADVPSGWVEQRNETTFISSFDFFDPDVILLEFAAKTRELGDPKRDMQHEPATATN